MNVEVYMIWVAEVQDPEAPWIFEAWDEFSMDANYEGFDAAVLRANRHHDIVKVIRTTVDYDSVVGIFNTVPTVESSGVTEVTND